MTMHDIIQIVFATEMLKTAYYIFADRSGDHNLGVLLLTEM